MLPVCRQRIYLPYLITSVSLYLLVLHCMQLLQTEHAHALPLLQSTAARLMYGHSNYH